MLSALHYNMADATIKQRPFNCEAIERCFFPESFPNILPATYQDAIEPYGRSCAAAAEGRRRLGDRPLKSCEELYLPFEKTDPVKGSNSITAEQIFRGSIRFADFVGLQTPLVQDVEMYQSETDPNILFMDFKNTAIQSAYLDRIADFTDIDDSQILGTNDFITRLQDQDAYCEIDSDDTNCGLGMGYDLEASNIARFFNALAEGSMDSTPEEQLFLDSLIAQGIITFNQQTQSYEATQNIALVGTARTFDNEDRKDVLKHEYHHGLYMTNDAYRSRIDQAWQGLNDHDRHLLKSILYYSSVHYNTDSDFVLTNEASAFSIENQDNPFDGNGWDSLLDSAYRSHSDALPNPSVMEWSELEKLTQEELWEIATEAKSRFEPIFDEFAEHQ